MESKISNRILAIILTMSLMLQIAMPIVYAKENNLAQETEAMESGDTGTYMLSNRGATPSIDGNKNIYANGIPIIIEAGTLAVGVQNSKIKFNDGTNDVYLDLDPDTNDIQEEMDLSRHTIYGGSNTSDVENTSITMTGGKIFNIFGGGYGSNSIISEDTHINISGTAEIMGDVCGGGNGNNVLGTSYITITGGDIGKDHTGVYGGGSNWSTVGRTEIKITGGNVNEVSTTYNPGGGSVNGDKTALITVPVYVKSSGFNNALYRDIDNNNQWIVKGNITLTNDLSITIAQDETMIVTSGSTLTTNGNLTNNGTIINKGTITDDISGTGSIVESPIVDDINKAIYANGIPITISKGNSDNESKISYGGGLFIDFGGATSKDLRGYSIYGGSNTEEKSNSNIEMNGGSVKDIYGGGKGFTVQNVTIKVFRGTVSGTIEGGGENSISTSYISILCDELNLETFSNLLYKEEESKWKIKGEYTISESDAFRIKTGETLKILESATLIIRGEFINEGTVINDGKIIGRVNGIIQGIGVVITEPTIDEDKKEIYANGIPIIVEEGSGSNYSKIKYYDGEGYVYLKIKGLEDLSIKDYAINGGGKNGVVTKTSITVKGGNFESINGGNATECVDIVVTGNVVMKDVHGGNIQAGDNENTISNLYLYYEGTDFNSKPYPDIVGFDSMLCYYPNIPLIDEWEPEIIKGQAVILEGYVLGIPSGKKMTIPKDTTLKIKGKLINNGSLLVEGCISDESTGVLEGSGIFETTVFTSDDIQAIPDQLYSGSAIEPNITLNSGHIYMGRVFNIDTINFAKSYENNINVGTSKIIFTSTKGDIVEKTFNIVKAATAFDGGIMLDKADKTYTYGEVITVSAKPKLTDVASRGFSAPVAGQMALFVGNMQITDAVSADQNDIFTMIYDTSGKDLVIGDNIITAKYIGDSNAADYSDNVIVKLNKKKITATVVENESKVYDGTNYFLSVDLNLTGVSSDTVNARASGTVVDINVATSKIFTAIDITLDGDHKDYYSLSATDVNGIVSIMKATTVGVNQQMLVIKDLAKEYKFELSELLYALSDGKNYGDISYTVESVINTNAVLEQNPTDSNILDGKITFNVANIDDKGKIAIIKIIIKSTNYNDFTADLNIETIDKIPLIIEAEFEGGIYNGNPYTYEGSPIFKDDIEIVSNVSYSLEYSGMDGTSYNKSEIAPTNVGKYNLIFTVSGQSSNTYAGKANITFEIAKKQITAKPDDVSIKSNVSFPTFLWNIETGIAGENLIATNSENVVMKVQEEGIEINTVKVGIFDIVFNTEPEFDQNDNIVKNYDIKMGKGKLTVIKDNSGGGSSGGGSSATPSKPSDNTSKETTITVTNDTANVDVSQIAVSNAIKEAQEQAKKNGTEKDGISVEIKVDTKNIKVSNISTNLSKETVDELIKAGVKELSINSGLGTITLDLETLKIIQKQLGEDVNISMKKIENNALSEEARAVVGNRPVFDFTIIGTNGIKVSEFGKGKVSISIPYTLGVGEKVENLAVYYIDSDGKVEEMPNSFYDEKSGALSFETNHFSKFAVGYKEDKEDKEIIIFTDITNHWAKDHIEFVAEKELFSGTGEGKFSPDMSMTRGMFVTVLGRLANADVSSYKDSSFIDVRSDEYYMAYAEWASENGIVDGIGQGKFAPDTFITREQMAVILYRYSQYKDYDTTQGGMTIREFEDYESISEYALHAMAWTVNTGLIQGSENNLSPKQSATRAQVATILMSFIQMVK